MSLAAARQDSAKPMDLLMAALLGIGLVWLLVSLALPLRYSFQNDSSGYVDEARMLLQGEGIRRAAPWHDTENEYAPTPLFPPGFAVQTALISLAGPDPAQAARIGSWLAWALLLPAILFATAPLVGRWAGLTVGMLVVLSPGLYEWGYPSMSDSSALLYSVLSLGMLIRAGGSSPPATVPLLVSGLLAGVAFAVRNAALVVPLAVAGTLVSLWLLRRQSFLGSFRAGLWWGLGFLLVAALVFGRNLLVFGAIQPYLEHHGGGDYGLLRAFRITLWSQLLDLTGSRTLADLAWDARALLLTLPPLAILLLWLGWRRRRELTPMAVTAFLALGLYCLIGFAMVVWGRSRFDWVEVDLVRHMMAYSWALLALSLWPLRATRIHSGSPALRGATLAILALAFVAALAGRSVSIRDDLDREAEIQRAGAPEQDLVQVARQVPDVILTNYIKVQLSRDTALSEYLKGRGDEPYLLSNFAAVLRLETGLPVRNFPLTPDSLAELESLSGQLVGRPVLLVAVPSNSMLRDPEAATWRASLLKRITVAHHVELSTPDLLVVELP